MFGKAARFPTDKVPDIPPPGYYHPKEVDGAPYKKGAFLEKSDRKVFDKIPDGPGPSDYQNMPSEMKGKVHQARKPSASGGNDHILRQQIQELQAENARLLKERERRHDGHQAEGKLEQAEARIRELVREKGMLQTEAAVATKEQRLAKERETAARLALDKAEKESKQAAERASKYSALQRRLEELEKLHSESKSKSRKDKGGLETELEQARASLAEKQKELDSMRHNREVEERRVQGLKKAHASAETDNQELRSKLQALQSAATGAEGSRAEKQQLESELQTLQSRHSKEVAELRAKLHDQESAATRSKQEIRDKEGENRKAKAQLREVEAKLARAVEELDNEKQARRKLETSMRTHGTDSKRAVEEERVKAIHEREVVEEQLQHVREIMTTVVEQYGALAAAMHKHRRHAAFERACAEATRVKLQGIVAEREGRIRQLAVALQSQEEVTATLVDGLNDYDSLVRSMLRHHSRSDEPLVAPTAILLLEANSSSESEWREGLLHLQEQMSKQFEELINFNKRWAEEGYDRVICELDEMQCENDAVQEKFSQEERIRMAAQSALADADERRATAEESATTAKAQLTDLKNQLTRLEESSGRVQSSLSAETEKLTNQLSSEKAYAAQLALDLAHGKSREAALAVDVDNLQETLSSAERYKSEYQALLAEVKVILSRNALAEDEADRLSRFNAEILSHQNPMQKILYVDKIRREMADVKQKLIVSTLERDTAEEERRKLQDELATYKAVEIPLDAKPRSVMTRVSRLPFAARSVNTLSKSYAQRTTDRSPTEHGPGHKGSTWDSENAEEALRVEDLRRS